MGGPRVKRRRMIRPKELKGEELLAERARLVLVDVERAGEVTQDALEAQAEELFQGSMPYAEKQQIVQRALELYAEKQRPTPTPAPAPPKEPKRLTSARTRELAIEYFRANPEGRSQDAFDWIEKTHGRPSCSRASFRSTTACIARRELGIVARSGRRPKPDAPAKPAESTKSTKPADLAKPKQQTVEVNVGRGSLRARPASAGLWRVSLEARVSEGLLKELMSDLVTGEEAVCQS